MKQLVVFSILLSSIAAYSSYAKDENCNCEIKSGIPADSTVTFLSKLAADISASKLRRLTVLLCSSLAKDDLDDPIIETIEKLLLKYSGISTSTPNYKQELAHTWNKYSPQIICKANETDSLPVQHFFVRSVIQGYHHNLLGDYFFEDKDKFPIDPNIIVKNQYGVDETVIDYIDRLLAQPGAKINYNYKQIEKLRAKIVNNHGGIKVTK